MLRIVLVHPDTDFVDRVEALFGPRAATRIEILHAADPETGIMRAARARPMVVLLSSVFLEDTDDARNERVVGAFAPVPVVVVAEPEHTRRAARALRSGAEDWLPCDSPVFATLPRIVAYVVERAELLRRAERAERALRRGEALMDLLFQSLPLPLLELDGEGRVRRAGLEAARLFDAPVAHLERQLLSDLLPGEDRPAFRAALAAAWERPGQPARMEVHLGRGPATRAFELAVVAPDGEFPGAALVWLRPAEAAADESRELGEMLRELLEQGEGEVPLAQLHLLGLERIRAALGDRWTVLRREVTALVERVLERELGPRERYRRVEQGFLLAFPGLSAAEVPERLAALSEAVEAAVLGAGDLLERVRREGLPLDGEALSRVARLDTRSGSVPFSGEDLVGPEDPWKLLERRFRTAAKPVPETELLLHRLYRHAEAEHVPVLDRDGNPSHLVLLVFDEGSRRHVERLAELGRNDPEALLKLDLFVLGRHLLLLDDDALEDTVPLVEVHYQTLVSRTAGHAYLDHLRALGVDAERRLGFLVRGVQPGTYAPRLEQAIAMLRDHSRLQAVQLEEVKGEAPDLRMARVPLVAIPFGQVPTPPSRPSEALLQTVRRIHRTKAEVLLREIPRGWAAVLRQRYEVDYTCIA